MMIQLKFPYMEDPNAPYQFKKGTRAYLCGPMRGFKNNNHDAFISAERYLRRCGLQTENPVRTAKLLNIDENKIEDNMGAILLKDMEIITRCHLIFMLDDWNTSQGAMAEFFFAGRIGVTIIFFDKLIIEDDDTLDVLEDFLI